MKNDELSDPHLDFELLLSNSKGVAVFSGTVFGLFGKLFDKGKFSEIDELYNKIFVNPIYDLGKFLWNKIDQGFIDRFLPNGSASLVSSIAKACKRFQSGFIFDYTFIIITGFTLFITIIFYISVS